MTRTTRRSERGAAMMVTLIVVASLLAGAAVLVAMQLGTNRSTDLTRSGMTAEYCAEAGAERAMPLLVASAGNWSPSLCITSPESTCQPTSPAGEVAMLAPPAINHDLDGDGVPDFVLYLRDDDDEIPGPQNYGIDTDNRVYIVSTCIKFPDTPHQVKELVQFNGGGGTNCAMLGGCNGRNNNNGI
jgi:hypothetical protein|nr:hypothetical protein [Kofleriaceae bacterium]